MNAPFQGKQLQERFRSAAANTPRKKKSETTTVSMRITLAEKAHLERQAAGMSVSNYLRHKALGQDVEPRRTRGRHPVKDYEALARVLGALGRSELSNKLSRLILAVEEGRAVIEDDLVEELRAIGNAVSAMRYDLVKALGLRER